MKRSNIIWALALCAAIALPSCTGLMMSTDFGYDDYGPSIDWYGPPYTGYYNGLFGPSWTTPPPPPRPLPPANSGNWQPNRPNGTNRPNGANRPNFIPENKPSSGGTGTPPATAPNGTVRPGNMGQGRPGSISERGRQTP